MDETFGLIETVEKAAQLYMLIAHLPHVNTIRGRFRLGVPHRFSESIKKLLNKNIIYWKFSKAFIGYWCQDLGEEHKALESLFTAVRQFEQDNACI